jgi:hypothetical protein
MKRRLVQFAALSVSLWPVASFAATETHNFDTGPEGFVRGSFGPSDSTDGWFNDNRTGGTSGPGEIGGIFVPDTALTPVFVADPTIGPGGNTNGFLVRSDTIHAEFEFTSNFASHANNSVFVGHFTRTANDGNFLGLDIEDGRRLFATYQPQGGGNSPGRTNPDSQVNLSDDVKYWITYDYTPPTSFPGDGSMVVNVFEEDRTTLFGTATASFDAGTITLTDWGMTGANVSGSNDMRLDGATYTLGAAVPNPTWNVDASGDWNRPPNWTVNNIAQGIGVIAEFGAVITAPRTVFTDISQTVGGMIINNANTYNFAGTGSMNIEVSSGTGLIDVQAGTQKMNLPLFFVSNSNINVATGATLLVSNPMTVRANRTVTKSGTMIMEAPLTLEAGAVLTLASGQTNLFGAPSLGAGAKIDAKNTSVTVDYRGLGSPAATIRGQLTTGYNAGAWNGSGIGTTAPLTVGGKAVGLGWKDDPATQSLLIKYTYVGDSNLDGQVDITDLGNLATAWQTAGVWANGDFDYSNFVDITDLGALATNWQAGVGSPLRPGDLSLSEALASLGLPSNAVPEPASMSLLGLGVLALASRRSRRLQSDNNTQHRIRKVIMRSDVKRSAIRSAVMAVSLWPVASFGVETHTFDAGPEGWVVGTGGPTGSSNGWFNEDRTGGLSGPGEIGGIFTPTTVENPVFIADDTIGPGGNTPGYLLRSDAMHAEFEWINSGSNHTNGGLFIGFMTPEVNDGNFVGMDIEDNGGGARRLYASYQGSGAGVTGPRTNGLSLVSLANDTPYWITFDYFPPSVNTGSIVASVFEVDRTTLVGTATASFTANSVQVTAFGITGGGMVGDDDLRIDNVSYTSGAAIPPPTWNADASGNWNTAGNWLIIGQSIPNAVGATAIFGSAITAPRTVFTDDAKTVGLLRMANANMYEITGNGSLTIEVASGTGSVDIQAGTQKINLPLFFASNTNINVASGATLLLSNPTTVRAGVTVNKTGNVLVQAPMILEAGAIFSLSGGRTTLIGAPALAAGAKVDVKDSTLTIDYRGGGSPATTIRSQLASAYNGGAWDGSGIGTSAPLSVSGRAMGLGWTDDVVNQSLQIGYTYVGDSNLDGQVDITDLGALAGSWQTGNVWAGGDFNYDNFVDISDLGALATNWQAGVGSPLRVSLAEALESFGLPGVAVPEPASLGLIGLTLATFTRFRGRRSDRRANG